MVTVESLSDGIVTVSGSAPTSLALKDTTPVFPFTLYTGAPDEVIYLLSFINSLTLDGIVGVSVRSLYDPLNLLFATAVATNSVVAIYVVLVPASAVGAVGTPVNDAEPLYLEAVIAPVVVRWLGKYAFWSIS
jgi:hypothetical protein